MGGAIIALLAVVLFVALILFRLIEVTFIRLGRARAAGLDEASGDELQLADLISDREVLLAPVTILRIISQVGLIVLAMNIGRSAGGTLLSVAVATFVLFLLGEAIPRRWAIEANDEMAKWLSRPARVIARLVPLQLIARLGSTIPVIAVDHEDQTLRVLEVVPAQHVLSTHCQLLEVSNHRSWEGG